MRETQRTGGEGGTVLEREVRGISRMSIGVLQQSEG